MSVKPLKKNYDLYKGARFTIKFRIVDCGSPVDITGWDFVFKAGPSKGGAATIEKSLTDSPTDISVDSASIVTVLLTDAETIAITTAELFYQVLSIEPGQDPDMRMTGILECREGLSDAAS